MWTQIITEVKKHNASFEFGVDFLKDGVFYDHFDFSQVSDPASVKQLIRNQLSQYQKIDAIKESDLLGAIDITLPISDPIPQPTEEEKAKQAYADKKLQLTMAKQDLDLGLIDDIEYTAKVAEVKAAKPIEIKK